MADYTNKLRGDLAEQFKGLPNIDALLYVVGKQMQELYGFFCDLREKRSLANAEGVQLDRIGDIVCLTRQDASTLYGIDNSGGMDDETYRSYLRYKLVQNFFSCTYNDLLRSIEMFWSGPTLRYSESRERPATISLDFEESGDAAAKALQLPVARASGVGIWLQAEKKSNIDLVTGFCLMENRRTIIHCEVPESARVLYLDESGNLLLDEQGNRLY